MKFLPIFDSLRFRFVLIAIVVSVLIVAAALFSFLKLNDARDQSTQNLSLRQLLLQTTSTINSNLVDAYNSLDLFLLDPSKESYSEKVAVHMDSAIEQCNFLIDSAITVPERDKADFIKIRASLQGLKTNINSLMEVRKDPSRQYPSMNVGNLVMEPNRNRVNNAFLIIFNELETENAIKTKPQVYSIMVHLRHRWSQMLSNFRLYLANRVGSFNENSLTIQENGIDTLFSELDERFAQAISLDEEGLLGFETINALLDAQDAITKWHAGFEESKKINHSNSWRMDSVIIQKKISPSISNINQLLKQIENRIDNFLEKDINTITFIARQSAWMLLALAIISIAFVILLVMLIQSLLFRPIMIVSRAMKSQAMGKQGHELPIASATETRELIDAFNEMYRQINLRQSELEYRAMHDALTSLPNRALLFEHITHDIQLANRANQQLSLMVIDLDRFKEVNDTLGHHIGDKFLIEVGARFGSVLRESDTVARMGGDEFAILVPDMGREQAGVIAKKILAALKEPIHVEEFELPCAASIGISTYPGDGDNAQILLQHADIAMYVAKRNQSGYEFYDAKHDEYSLRRLELINELRSAIENKALELAFQPVINLPDQAVYCMESLLRWKHPEHGYISPELIIDMAEQTGLIIPLTYLVLEQALTQQSQWAKSGIPVRVSVNLSMHNLRDRQLVDRIKKLMEKYSVNENQLILEITESAMMSNPHQVIDILEQLAAMRVTIAIDDFGTGFSSLAYLKKLPVGIIKIDRSFIVDLANDVNDQAIVQATLRLSHELGLRVIAEGVEDRESLILLSQYGYDAIQGFYISKPLNSESLSKWLARYRPEQLI
jgi:diguanylate cyclase (GGDEF)-like protein